jgi:hypothetical protein
MPNIKNNLKKIVGSEKTCKIWLKSSGNPDLPVAKIVSAPYRNC